MWNKEFNLPSWQHWTSIACRVLGGACFLAILLRGLAASGRYAQAERWTAGDTFALVAELGELLGTGIVLFGVAVVIDCAVYAARVQRPAELEAAPAPEVTS